jgi:hypothetical protein
MWKGSKVFPSLHFSISGPLTTDEIARRLELNQTQIMFPYENHIAEQELRKNVLFRSRLARSLNKTNVTYWSQLAKSNPKESWKALLAQPFVYVA